MVLGHLLRGGTPSSLDRLLGVRFGTAAVRGLEEGHRGVMVALQPPHVSYVPLVSAISKMRVVPLDSDTIVAARDRQEVNRDASLATRLLQRVQVENERVSEIQQNEVEKPFGGALDVENIGESVYFGEQ